MKLNSVFENEKFPTKEMYAELMAETSLSEKVLRIWFQNKRAKSKKMDPVPLVPTPGEDVSTEGQADS